MDPKNAKIKRISKIYEKFENLVGVYNMVLNIQSEKKATYEPDEEVNKLGKSLRSEIDELLLMIEENSDEMKRVSLLKAFTLYLEMQVMNFGENCTIEEEREAANQLVSWTEKYGDKPEGFCMHLFGFLMLTRMLESEENWTESLRMALMCEEIYKNYTTNHKDVPFWKGDNYLEYINRTLSSLVKCYDRTLSVQYSMIASSLFIGYTHQTPPDHENAVRYAIEPLKIYHEIYPWNCLIPIHCFLKSCVEKIDVMIHCGCYKQVDHLLAVAMNLAVHERRSLPADARYKMDHIQGKLSLMFAFWGEHIAERSTQMIHGDKNVTKIKNELYEEFNFLMTDGYLVYIHQFPVDLVTNEEEIKKILKRARTWAKRAHALMKNRPCHCGSDCIKRLDTFEEHNFS